MTPKQKLILYFIDSGFADNQYDLVKQLDRYDFPAELGKNLQPLLEAELVVVSAPAFNGTPFRYTLTEKGSRYINETSVRKEVLNYITTLENNAFLLQLTTGFNTEEP